MASVRARLGVGLVLSLVGLLGLQWLVVNTAIRSLAENYVASRLAHDTARVLAILTFTSDGRPVLPASHFTPGYHQPFSGYYYEIVTAKGHALRSRSLWDADLAPPLLAPGQARRIHDRGPKEQRLLMLASGFQKQGHFVTIAVAEDLAPLEEELGQFERRYLLVSSIILLILIAAQQWIVRLGFQPLQQVRQEMARLERGEISQLDEAVPTEVRPLVQEMNRLLAVMEQRLQRSRNALGNLAHALKTPLTLVMQLASQDELTAVPQVRAQLLKQTEILRRRLEHELRRARLAGAAMPGRRLVLAEELPALVDVVRRVHQDKRLAVECRIPPQAVFVGDREDILELLGNLLDNACKWARYHVLVTVQDQPGLAVRIEDDGQGCPLEVRKQLAERGVRIDESTTGHGLGLAIVRDIVEQYGGDMGFGRSHQLGGFQVCVTLPPRFPHS
jgi:signal transduction histidine kinase